VVSADTDFATLLALRRERRPRSYSSAAAPNGGPDQQAALLLANLPALEQDLTEGAVVVLQLAPRRERCHDHSRSNQAVWSVSGVFR
jgi:hypothetical protein